MTGPDWPGICEVWAMDDLYHINQAALLICGLLIRISGASFIYFRFWFTGASTCGSIR